MNTQPTNPLFRLIRRILPAQILAMPFFAASTLPTDPWKVPFLEGAPEGLKLLHVADNVPEAGLLTDVLIQAGFHVEYVPPTTTGLFGTSGTTKIYVPVAEADDAAKFLADYLNPPPEPEAQAQ